MIKTKSVKVKWNSKIKKHYLDRGYKFTNMGDEFDVSPEDLTNGSNVKVKVVCDYCGREYDVAWYHRINSNKVLNKDCCKSCRLEKQKELNIIRYGVEFPLVLDTVKNKRKNTLQDKYGVDNVFQLDSVKEKIVKTNLKKYGVEYSLQNKDIKRKAEETLFKKYGVKNYSQSQEWKDKYSKENSPRWKGGIKWHRVERATIEYREWRNAVFSRDGYICKNCGEHSRHLQAHHIFNWKDNKELRYDVNNGITLCSNCHIEFHRKYGKQHNNNIQLREFLINKG